MFTELEEKVKSLIKKSLMKRIEGLDRIDNLLPNETLVDCWLTDIMALGFNESDLGAAVGDIYEMQAPLMEAGLIPLLGIDAYRARVSLSYNRFSEEVSAFEKYVELRGSENEKAVLYAVRQELEYIDKGDFSLF